MSPYSSYAIYNSVQNMVIWIYFYLVLIVAYFYEFKDNLISNRASPIRSLKAKKKNVVELQNMRKYHVNMNI